MDLSQEATLKEMIILITFGNEDLPQRGLVHDNTLASAILVSISIKQLPWLIMGQQ